MRYKNLTVNGQKSGVKYEFTAPKIMMAEKMNIKMPGTEALCLSKSEVLTLPPTTLR